MAFAEFAATRNDDSDLESADGPSVPARPVRSFVEVVSFVAAWMTCGWLFTLDSSAYLVLGVPCTILFQRFVRRRPLRTLWVREAPPFRLGGGGIAIASILSVMPLLELAATMTQPDLGGTLFSTCGVVGAIGAAYAMRHFEREHIRPLVLCLVVTSSLDAIQWSLVMACGLITMTSIENAAVVRPCILIASLLEYMAIAFVIEEVTFRMLDSHLRQEGRFRGLLSALVISVAWGLWHLPVVGEEATWSVVGMLLCIHVPYGICLSYFWWKTGNLVIPALCHSLGDAIRNAILYAG